MTDSFPGVTGRIYPALYEQAYVLDIHQPPTMTRLDGQTVTGQTWDLDCIKPLPPQCLVDQAVTVVGSGLTGPATTQQLTRAGHAVTVYKKDDVVSSLMRYNVPNSKPEKGLFDRRVRQAEAEGTYFRTNVEIGRGIIWGDLCDRRDTIVVVVGSRIPRGVKIPDCGLDGIHLASDFLPDAMHRIFGVKPVRNITTKDKHVVVIGGGDTGPDCLDASVRQGAKDVIMLRIMPREPLNRPSSSPWSTLTHTCQKTPSVEEDGKHTYSTNPVDFEGTEEKKAKVTIDDSTAAEDFMIDERGHVTGLKVVSVAPSENGPFTHQPGTERVLLADLALISAGFLHSGAEIILDQLSVELDKCGDIVRNDKFATSQNGMFVYDDASRGQGLVAWVIAESRSYAVAADKYLSKEKSELPTPIEASQRLTMLPRWTLSKQKHEDPFFVRGFLRFWD